MVDVIQVERGTLERRVIKREKRGKPLTTEKPLFVEVTISGKRNIHLDFYSILRRSN